MAEVICFSILIALVTANAAFTLWLAKHVLGALSANQKLMANLHRRQDILLDMMAMDRSQAKMQVSRHDCHMRRLAHKIGDECLVKILTHEPEDDDKEPVSLAEIAKSLTELSKTLDAQPTKENT